MDEVYHEASANLRVYAGLQCYGPGGSDDIAAQMLQNRAKASGEVVDEAQLTAQELLSSHHGLDHQELLQSSLHTLGEMSSGNPPHASDLMSPRMVAERELRARWAVVRKLGRHVFIRIANYSTNAWFSVLAKLSVLTVPMLKVSCLCLAMVEYLLCQMVRREDVLSDLGQRKACLLYTSPSPRD